MPPRDDARPWYREPLVWLLIAIPASAVVAGFVTLALAIATDDGLVADDYYWRGKEINRVLERDRAAAAGGLAADVRLDEGRGLVAVRLTARAAVELPAELRFSLLHATRAGLDRQVALARAPDGEYYGLLGSLPAGRWHVQLETDHWRLTGRLATPDERELRIVAASGG